jgi:drug/metabolite transporter (DMT)-like permease
MTQLSEHERAARAPLRGALCGLSAAALFGLSTPLAKRLLGEVSPQLLAGLLYLGAGVSLHAWRVVRPETREAALTRSDAGWLAGIIVAGGVVGPLLMLIGLNRISGVTASLLLNLEAPFTMALAVLVFREHLGRYGLAAVAFILSGALLLNVERSSGVFDAWGAAAITAACLAWAIDNNLTQRLSARDPVALVRIKTLAAGSINVAIALAMGSELPGVAAVCGALAVGATGYGLSVVLDTYALRLVGAAREAAYFATAPFVGALAATVILGEALESSDVAAMTLMVLGVVALLRERHAHTHAHEPLEHDHLHVHDAHHQHAHGPGVSTTEPHAHAHRHAGLVHDHPHVPDAHHRHRH